MAATKKTTVSGSAKASIDHDEIREWVESHGGHPAMVKRTARNGKGGILRIDFPGYSGKDTLEEVSWDQFFDKFEESQLAFLYQDQAKSGRPSRFNKLVSRESLAAPKRRSKTSKRATAPAKKAARRGSAAKKSTTRRAAPSAGSPRRAASKAVRGRSTKKRSTKKKSNASRAGAR